MTEERKHGTGTTQTARQRRSPLHRFDSAADSIGQRLIANGFLCYAQGGDQRHARPQQGPEHAAETYQGKMRHHPPQHRHFQDCQFQPPLARFRGNGSAE